MEVSAIAAGTITRSLLARALYFLAGSVSLLLLAFSFLPGIPTADLVVLSLFFFARSSPRFEQWLRGRAVVQRILSRYEGGLTRRTKIQATVGIVGSLAVSAGFLTQSVTIRSLLGFVGIYALWFVWSRPVRPADRAVPPIG
jgi:uncharacterized membrane protein YbaN (DUF454 family)